MACGYGGRLLPHYKNTCIPISELLRYKEQKPHNQDNPDNALFKKYIVKTNEESLVRRNKK